MNMAYSKISKKTNYPFGRTDVKHLEKILDSNILVMIPLDPKVNYQNIAVVLRGRNEISLAMRELVQKMTV